MSDNKRQEGITYGNAWMHKTLISLLKVVDRRVFYVFMYVFVIPVTLVLSNGSRLTFRYFRRRRGYGMLKSLWSTYRNHCIFGETVIDKFAMYAGHRFKVIFDDEARYRAMTEGPDAFLQLSAHIGCSEILGYSYHVSKPCNVLVFGGEKQSLMGYRSSSFGEMNVNMIPVGVEATHSEEIVGAFDRGEIVIAFADRLMNPKKVITSRIHGYGVSLAKGPFSMAVTRGIDVVMVNAMKEKNGSYRAFFTPLTYDKQLPASQQRQQLADAYTAEIERLMEMYPLQWFNYFDLWIDSLQKS